MPQTKDKICKNMVGREWKQLEDLLPYKCNNCDCFMQFVPPKAEPTKDETLDEIYNIQPVLAFKHATFETYGFYPTNENLETFLASLNNGGYRIVPSDELMKLKTAKHHD